MGWSEDDLQALLGQGNVRVAGEPLAVRPIAPVQPPPPTTPKRAIKRLELPLQETIVRVLEWRGYLVLATNIEIPLGGDAARIAAIHRKRAGVKNGTPDLAVCLDGGRIVWIEVKVPGDNQLNLRGLGGRRRQPGRTSDDQDELHEKLRAKGHRVAVVHSVEQALEAVVAA